MPDDRPQYENYKRPSPITCVVGVIIAFVIWGVIYAFLFFGYPEMRAAITYPLLAIALLILVAGVIYYVVSNRRHQAEISADQAEKAKQRVASDDWVSKELAESPYYTTDAQANADDSDAKPDGQ